MDRLFIVENNSWGSKTVEDILKTAGITRWVSERFSPDYKEHMDKLREAHEKIWEWTKSLHSFLVKAQEAKKLGKPMDVIFYLSQINARLKLAAGEQKELSDLQEEHLERYFSEREHDVPDDYFDIGAEKLVEAGILDNLGRKLTTWRLNKAYRRQLMERDRALVQMLNLARATVGRVEALLKQMTSSRDNGDIFNYIKLLGHISAQQKLFDSQFRAIYDKHFAAMVERIRAKKRAEEAEAKQVKDEFEAREKARLETAKPTEPVPETVPMTIHPPVATVPASPATMPSKPSVLQRLTPEAPDTEVSSPISSGEDLPIESEQPTKPVKQPAPLLEEESPNTMRSASAIELFLIKSAHAEFYKELEKASASNNPRLLGAMLVRYSGQIEDSDPQASMELLAIAEGILDA